MPGDAFGGLLAGAQHLLTTAVVLGVIMDHVAFIDLFEHVFHKQEPQLLIGGAEYVPHVSTAHVSIREIIAAEAQYHAETRHCSRALVHQFEHLAVQIEAVNELHVTTPCHQSSPLVIPLYAIQMASCRGVVQGRPV